KGLKPQHQGRLRSERSLNLCSYHFAVTGQLSQVNCLTDECVPGLSRQRPIDRAKLFVRIIYVSLAGKNARSPEL
ncbi:hypothetical protein QT971_01695, partial [Microcoleus sp. herbarium19]|uniref:hypothetical protein n=1 Tax=Microcoleus sp. herbarium19 TaxID=3055440 RepID=UPI002FD6EAB1